MAPIITRLVEDEVVKPVAFDQVDVFGSATLFARTEGIIPAPETAHAVHAAIELARQSAKRDEKRVILIGFSGHGLCLPCWTACKNKLALLLDSLVAAGWRNSVARLPSLSVEGGRQQIGSFELQMIIPTLLLSSSF